MQPTRLVPYALFCVLILQLIHTSPHFSVSAYSHGVLALQAAAEEMQTSRSTPLLVSYVKTEQPYDGLLFLGDVLLARNIEYLMSINGAEYPYRGINFSALSQRPAVVGNFESSIPAQHVPTPVEHVRFSVSPQYIPQLALAGFTHFSLANNHTFDFSQPGYINTKTVLSESQLTAFGHPKQLDIDAVEFIQVHDTVVAVIAAHTLEQLPTYSGLQAVFRYATARSDFQMVYVHWGTEYAPVHNSRQREAAERFVDAGADVIIGHHPHVVQDIELIDSVPVFYSLGNYIFDQYHTPETQKGLLLHLTFTGGQSAISLLPVTSEGTMSQPHFMDAQPHSQFLRTLAEKSDPALRAFIESGQIFFGAQVASSSKVAMIST
jgi:poly-gamma-glutamate synthesis protein (capsule biosynthesis protein)